MQNWEQYKPEKFEYNGRWIKNWFSNMIVSPIIIDNQIWPSVENYYQAMKTTDFKWQEAIRLATPLYSKKLGRAVPKNLFKTDWEEVKYECMKTGLRAKFTQNQAWWKELIKSENNILIEWNNWGDRIWGVDISDCMGQNLLGKALMEIREELISKNS